MSLLNDIRNRAKLAALNRKVKRAYFLKGAPGKGKKIRPEAMVVIDRPGGGRLHGFFQMRAAKTYSEILKREGISPSDLYVTAAVKTRPGLKAPSERYEMKLWMPILQEEIELVRPKKLFIVGPLANTMRGVVKRGPKTVSAATKKAV